MDPSFANVKAYMEIQKLLLERSSRFAQRWLEVVYQTPQLDYTLKHPVSQVGRHVYADTQHKQMQRRIRQLAQTHGLFFFFSSGCEYCKTFAPIVKRFAETYGWQVLAISMDGSRLPEFPQAQNDNGTARVLGVKALPTLLAVDPKSGQVVPLSHGLSTQDQIEDRIRVLLLRRMP
jgi:conjugal transfer pilus assembly protein TraF